MKTNCVCLHMMRKIGPPGGLDNNSKGVFSGWFASIEGADPSEHHPRSEYIIY